MSEDEGPSPTRCSVCITIQGHGLRVVSPPQTITYPKSSTLRKCPPPTKAQPSVSMAGKFSRSEPTIDPPSQQSLEEQGRPGITEQGGP